MKKPTKQQLREKFLRRFAGKDRSALIKAQLDEKTLIPDILNFIAAQPTVSKKLFDLQGHVVGLGNRLGRGEVLVWFIFDDVELGGSSSSHDVIIDGKPTIEIKCAKRTGIRYCDFFMGIDEVPASLHFFWKLLKLFEKNERAGKITIPQRFANINKSKIDELKKISTIAYKQLEDSYFDELEAGKIGKKKFLFFDKETTIPIFFGRLTRDYLFIERISGGLVRLSFTPPRS